MSNQELAAIFQDLADMEEIEGNRWESLAYGKVALSIATLLEDVGEMRRKGTLRNIEGVGQAIEKKIIQYLETGGVEKHTELKKKYPIDFSSMRQVQGLGSKRIASLYQNLGITNLEELEGAIERSEVSVVPGFGKKSQESLKKAIEVHKRTGSSRLFLANIHESLERLLQKIRQSGLFKRVEIAGSVRRRRETIGDLDILAVCNDVEKCIDYFTSLDEVEDVIVRGESKVSVRLSFGINCDLRIMENDSYGAAMQYFTGSKEHNIKMRDLAISKDLKLNEYGLFRGEESVAGKDESEVYSYLGLDLIPPELRENLGEIDAARSGTLPDLVKYENVKGDFHTHTDESDGSNTLEEMVNRASELGRKYIAITDHSKSLRVANGLDEERFAKRNLEIDRINDSGGSTTVLKGVELEILKDGSLDLSDELLDEMDIVVVALHQWVKDDIKSNTDRVLKAIESGKAFTLAHPTGRMIGTREPYKLDFEKIFQACSDNGVAIEINGYPDRSDLPYDLVKRAKDYSLKYTLGSDSHRLEHLRFLEYATHIARRGWLEEKDVLNCLDVNKLKKVG